MTHHHHLDFHLLPDEEASPLHLMSALFTRLHRVLALTNNTAIAVSFPGYGLAPRQLGNRLRLVGPADKLDALLTHDWLKAVRDHVRIDSMAMVPASATPRCLRRVQAKSSPERLRRRQMRRHGLTEAQARERIPDTVAETLNLPYLVLPSASTGQSFPLFLHLGPPLPAPLPGDFNTYGLSTTATTPWF
jgi:CRISPR-associated endonuclease Csy4